MDKIPFMKMNGCGNDFIVVDNREDIMRHFNIPDFVRRICMRRISVGADGFMMLEKSHNADFKMRYFNSDGSEGEMCGNGARCIARFAYLIGAGNNEMKFETISGIYEAQIKGENVLLKFPPLKKRNFELNNFYDFDGKMRNYCYAYVGVPHVVLYENDVNSIDYKNLVTLGRMIRYALDLFPNGTNVNFIEVLDKHNVNIRTYERGVEDETFACGTGSTASAIISGLLGKVNSPVLMHTRAGSLKIYYKLGEKDINDICLEGDAKVAVEGFLLPDSWGYKYG